jgi:hypothetical protein
MLFDETLLHKIDENKVIFANCGGVFADIPVITILPW